MVQESFSYNPPSVPEPVISLLQLFPTFLVTVDYRDTVDPPPLPAPLADPPMADLCHDCGPRGQGDVVQEVNCGGD